MKTLKIVAVTFAWIAMCLGLPSCANDDDYDEEELAPEVQSEDTEETTADEDETNDNPYLTGTINGYGYVDLGLSVLWATCNVGASSPEKYGDYFAWGETSTKSSYALANSNTVQVSMADIGSNARYDVARAKWGSTWRLPTKAEMDELITDCYCAFVDIDGQNGYKITGPNGNSIFFPLAGYYSYTFFYAAGKNGSYWSSTPYEGDNNMFSYCLSLGTNNCITSKKLRYYGLSIRPVSEKTEETSGGSSEKSSSQRDTINGHEYVDMGLSVKWATCNIGASSPEEYGDYFAWGETSPKSSFTESNSKTYHKSRKDIAGNAQYDAARANWGGTWRMPTKDEMYELIDSCQWKWTTKDSVCGYKVVAPNGRGIFLPASGYRNGTSLLDDVDTGSLWTSTPASYDNSHWGACYLNMERTMGVDVFTLSRYIGLCIRPVSD